MGGGGAALAGTRTGRAVSAESERELVQANVMIKYIHGSRLTLERTLPIHDTPLALPDPRPDPGARCRGGGVHVDRRDQKAKPASGRVREKGPTRPCMV